MTDSCATGSKARNGLLGVWPPGNVSHCMGNPPASGWEITYEIRVLVRQDENGPNQSVDEDLNTLIAGVYNAICGETDWWTMDGNALNAMWDQSERELDELQSAAYQMALKVYYRTDETNLLNRR